MRSFSRAVAMTALTLPLAFAGTGLAAASTMDAMPRGGGGHHVSVWKWFHVSDNDKSYFNQGIVEVAQNDS